MVFTYFLVLPWGARLGKGIDGLKGGGRGGMQMRGDEDEGEDGGDYRLVEVVEY